MTAMYRVHEDLDDRNYQLHAGVPASSDVVIVGMNKK